jgi:hypothetical protein
MAIKTIRNDEHADGKLPISAGSNITLTDTGNTLVIAATTGAGGVSSITASTGISTSASTGAVTLTNTGVTSIVAGTGISISGATGAVTVTSTASGSGGYTKTFMLMGA